MGKLMVVALAGLLAGCATTTRYVRADANPGNFEVDRTVCQGETEKAEMSRGRSGDLFGGHIVFEGCMASRGWVKAQQ